MTDLKTHDLLGVTLAVSIAAALVLLYQSGNEHFAEMEAICSAHDMAWKDFSKADVCIDKAGRIYDPETLR